MTDPIFATLPKESCLLVFRVEKFELKPWNSIGSFYSGDSYVVLHAYTKGTSKTIYRDIYFWLGSETTQDEAGTAAIKTVEMDDFFGGSPIQHREVQGHETDAFFKLFDQFGGVRYMDGGIEGGFREIKEETAVILYQIKGRRRPVLQQVRATGESLNQGDVFILQTPKKFFLWIGQKANVMEKNKAANVLDMLLAKHPKAAEERLEGGNTTPEFWQFLGGEKPIKSAEEAGADAEFESSNVRTIYGFDGKATKLFEGAAATKDKLNSQGIFIIVRGQNMVIFQGRQANPEHAKKIMTEIGTFLAQNNLPSWMPVSISKEGVDSDELDVIFA